MSTQYLQEQFAPFASRIGDIYHRTQDGEEPESITGFTYTNVDAQSYIDEFKIPGETSGKGYLARLYRLDDKVEGAIPLPEHINQRVDTLALALGHVGFEQVVAYSTETPAIVVEDVPGTRLDQIDISFPLEDYKQLFKIFRSMVDLSLGFEDHYVSSIVLGEYDYENPLKSYEFTAINYFTNTTATFLDHVLAFGRETTMSRGPGTEISNEALRYYVACHKHLGKRTGLELIYQWLRKGHVIPTIDYDIDSEDEPPHVKV